MFILHTVLFRLYALISILLLSFLLLIQYKMEINNKEDLLKFLKTIEFDHEEVLTREGIIMAVED